MLKGLDYENTEFWRGLPAAAVRMFNKALRKVIYYTLHCKQLYKNSNNF
jgi:hypothetical protein